jgi:hypothetical protein
MIIYSGPTPTYDVTCNFLRCIERQGQRPSSVSPSNLRTVNCFFSHNAGRAEEAPCNQPRCKIFRASQYRSCPAPWPLRSKSGHPHRQQIGRDASKELEQAYWGQQGVFEEMFQWQSISSPNLPWFTYWPRTSMLCRNPRNPMPSTSLVIFRVLIAA